MCYIVRIGFVHRPLFMVKIETQIIMSETTRNKLIAYLFKNFRFSLNHANSWHADYFIFTFVSPSLKFTIFYSFTVQYDLDIADSSCMRDACQIWTYYIYI